MFFLICFVVEKLLIGVVLVSNVFGIPAKSITLCYVVQFLRDYMLYS